MEVDVFCTYSIQICGVDQPIDITVELPEWLGDMAIAAQSEKCPNGAQAGAIAVLTTYATDRYREFLDDPTVVLAETQVALRRLEVDP